MMPMDTRHIVSDLAARPTSTRIGAPKTIPKLLPVMRLLAAGVSKSSSRLGVVISKF